MTYSKSCVHTYALGEKVAAGRMRVPPYYPNVPRSGG